MGARISVIINFTTNFNIQILKSSSSGAIPTPECFFSFFLIFSLIRFGIKSPNLSLMLMTFHTEEGLTLHHQKQILTQFLDKFVWELGIHNRAVNALF